MEWACAGDDFSWEQGCPEYGLIEWTIVGVLPCQPINGARHGLIIDEVIEVTSLPKLHIGSRSVCSSTVKRSSQPNKRMCRGLHGEHVMTSFNSQFWACQSHYNECQPTNEVNHCAWGLVELVGRISSSLAQQGIALSFVLVCSSICKQFRLLFTTCLLPGGS